MCCNVSSDPTLTDTKGDPFHYVFLQSNLIRTSRLFLSSSTFNQALWTGGKTPGPTNFESDPFCGSSGDLPRGCWDSTVKYRTTLSCLATYAIRFTLTLKIVSPDVSLLRTSSIPDRRNKTYLFSKTSTPAVAPTCPHIQCAVFWRISWP